MPMHLVNVFFNFNHSKLKNNHSLLNLNYASAITLKIAEILAAQPLNIIAEQVLLQ